MPAIATDGATIAYLREGQGPPVLCLQGVGLDGRGWRPQVDELSRRFSLICPDNRGIGGSVTRGPISIEAMAADALAVLDAEGVPRAHVVGHSMGGIIAQQVALAAPHRVKSLALLCTFASGAQGARITLPMLLIGLRTRLGTRRMRRHAFLELVMPHARLREADLDALANELAPIFGHDLADQPSIAMAQLSAMKRYDARGRLGSLDGTPTLVVSAAEDRIALPVFGRELAACIPGAVYKELSGAAHGATIHDAATVNRLLDEHWTSAERSSARGPTA